MTRTSAVAMVAVAALCGCGPGASRDGGSNVELLPHGTPELSLGFSADAPTTTYVSVDQFELATTTQIRVVADFANVETVGAERLDLYGPNGNLWYTTVIPFTGATGSDRAVTALPDGSLRAIYVLEVAGTPIETYQMTGAWRAAATLDGTATAVSRTFELR